jgi:hypothetical protein
MKILAAISERKFVAEIDKDEIEKVLGLYYNNMPRITVGQVIPISSGYDYSVEIKRVCESMQSSMVSFERASGVLTKFAQMVAELPSAGSDGATS